MLASAALAWGITKLRPALRAAKAAGSMPLTALTSPDKPSSPIHSNSSRAWLGICLLAANKPRAMARSKRAPSLGKSAGAKLKVMRFCGNSRPLLIMALRTRSLLSRTAVSGKPTKVSIGRPLLRCTSTCTWGAAIPIWARLLTIANDIVSSLKT